MSPLVYLFACIAVAIGAFLVDLIDDLRLRAKLRALADGHGLHFSAADRFNFAAAVARRFPVPGIADPQVADLLYGRRENRYQYIFRFDYTIGVTGRKQRRRAIVGFSEGVDRTGAAQSPLQIARQDCPVIIQYERLAAGLLPASA